MSLAPWKQAKQREEEREGGSHNNVNYITRFYAIAKSLLMYHAF